MSRKSLGRKGGGTGEAEGHTFGEKLPGKLGEKELKPGYAREKLE